MTYREQWQDSGYLVVRGASKSVDEPLTATALALRVQMEIQAL